MQLNQTIRGRYGTTITEAAMMMERNVIFRDRVTRFLWDHVDDDEPLEPMVPTWNEAGNPNKLNKDLLWELAGPGYPTGTDEQLRDHLLRQLGNREKVWRLMEAAVRAASGGAATQFMNEPVAAANAAANAGGCTNAAGGPIDLYDLMRIMHMYGKRDTPEAPRPMDPIVRPDDYFYTTEAQVAVEIRRRVRELIAGVTWEGNVTGGREKKKLVWHRYGLYCGCG